MAAIPDEFVPLHVHYRRDRAIRAAGVHAELLFLRSLAFARANRTGGLIEDFDLDDLGVGMPDVIGGAATLVRVGLWVACGTGWLIRSWEKWNPAGGPSESGSFGNHKRWHVDRGIVAPNCPHCPQEPADSSPPNRPDIAPIIAPIRGGIAEESRGEEKESRGDATKPSRKRPATRIPADWSPSAANRRYAEENGIDIDHELAQFLSHHTAKDSRFADWSSAFRTWLGNAKKWSKPATSKRPANYTEWEIA